jgi:glycosyltransferase involved in cell wall biosynthesis
MKLILAMNLPYEPPLGGAIKGNRRIVEQLAAAGHEVRAVVPDTGIPALFSFEELVRKLAERGIAVSRNDTAHYFRMNGVDVHAVRSHTLLRKYLVRQIKEFCPDCVLVASEDPSQSLLHCALQACPKRIVYMLFTPNFLPFGPYAFFPGQRRASLLKNVAAIIATSRFCAEYVRRWSDLEPVMYYPHVYNHGPYPNLGRFDAGYVTLINPCRYKGLSIFIKLARQMPEVEFAAVPGWGTTSEDRALLDSIPNIRILPPTPDEDELFGQTRILLLPSLWLENFPLTITEAMLRGIPVIGSNVGGIPEAMLSTGFLIPVRPIEQFSNHFDENQLVVPEIPEQEIDPWQDAVRQLISDRALYERESAIAREKATTFVGSLSLTPLEEVLERVARA